VKRTGVVGHKSLTKRLVVESLSDIETSNFKTLLTYRFLISITRQKRPTFINRGAAYEIIIHIILNAHVPTRKHTCNCNVHGIYMRTSYFLKHSKQKIAQEMPLLAPSLALKP